MPPEPRLVPRFAAEPPQELAPYGRWADRLREEFLTAARSLEDVGEPGEVVFYPDRTWHGRTWVPATAPTSSGLELVGFVSFRPAPGGGEPAAFAAEADATEETAAAHPEWKIDLNDEVVGRWRGEEGRGPTMTLVWARRSSPARRSPPPSSPTWPSTSACCATAASPCSPPTTTAATCST